MENDPQELKIARPDSWKTVKMPDTVAFLPFYKTYTSEEFSILSRGFCPREMEDKWFIFMQDNTLFFHRSWTGVCIYKVSFDRQDSEYTVKEALVNRDFKQYKITDDSYDIKLLEWLIDGYLLCQKVPFPLTKDTPSVVFQHHISGTAYPEVQSQEKEEG